MNIALIGHGKTGKEIERLAPEHNIKVVQIFDGENNDGASGLTKQSLKNVDVCIDFSVPHAAMENIEAVARCGKSLVVGTTGWYDKLPEVKKMVEKSKIGFLYAANFSLGVNIFYHGVSIISELCDKFHFYDVAIAETHHTQKLDAPSATALALAQTVMQKFKSKKTILQETPRTKIKPEQMQITSTRLGSVVGNHRVVFDSEADCIELVHSAKNRTGFAHGALIAAQWLKGKKGVYTMKDVITSML
ncbi:MAG: 4-hydroxy-tetrahydrodipicolinate reductase [Ignavibacteriae bacterium]|nr:4-hydroxy-tetrahydrodipicolinate reductase [Ignavibacteriota bacterium]